MYPFVKSLLIVFALGTALIGQETATNPPANSPSVSSRKPYFNLPEPPLGYILVTQTVAVEGEYQGIQLLLANQQNLNKVVVRVDENNFTKRAARVSATKDYVSKLSTGLTNQGYKVIEQNDPDIATTDFKTPVIYNMVLEKETGEKLHIKKSIFFTTKGYDYTIVAEDEDNLRMLTSWATRVRPAK